MNYSLERLPMGGMLGETKPSYLFDYGIHNEGSDIRAHVCVLAGTVYVYPTVNGVRAVESGKFRGTPAKQPGYSKVTAWGYLVPPKEIARCLPISARAIIREMNFSDSDTPTAKGEKAVNVVAELLRIGWFPLPVDPKIILDADMQISGTDINVSAKFRIQVKCDYRGGIGDGCSGNLYLQTAEINPLKRT